MNAVNIDIGAIVLTIVFVAIVIRAIVWLFQDA